jgi:hypothetical protein
MPFTQEEVKFLVSCSERLLLKRLSSALYQQLKTLPAHVEEQGVKDIPEAWQICSAVANQFLCQFPLYASDHDAIAEAAARLLPDIAYDLGHPIQIILNQLLELSEKWMLRPRFTANDKILFDNLKVMKMVSRVDLSYLESLEIIFKKPHSVYCEGLLTALKEAVVLEFQAVYPRHRVIQTFESCSKSCP